MKLDQKLNYLLLFTIVLTLLLIVVMTMKSKESFIGGSSMQQVSSNNTGGGGMQKVPSNNTSGIGFNFSGLAANMQNAVDTAGTAVGHTAIDKKTAEMARNVKVFCDKYGHKGGKAASISSVQKVANRGIRRVR